MALGKAWDRLRPQTKEDVIAHLLRMWDEYDDDRSLPDVGQVADLLEQAMQRPDAHAEEDYPGFGKAAEYLWSLWVAERHGVEVPLSRDVPNDADARRAVGPLLADRFGLTEADAEKRFQTVIAGRNRAKGRDRPIAGRRRLSKP
ncbi:hypothetical protein [Sphingomonas faeni]|uniref:hypothetical protein n=1 Tax=Sphingomonas faeni TaxID=185950 RepID=UPI002781790C|nr:hypothetical protein [Sphingomonas faeni]MDQ0839517.1 hypothetical protein [Sphingomonas faeni]